MSMILLKFHHINYYFLIKYVFSDKLYGDKCISNIIFASWGLFSPICILNIQNKIILETAPMSMTLFKFHHINYYFQIKSTRDTHL